METRWGCSIMHCTRAMRARLIERSQGMWIDPGPITAEQGYPGVSDNIEDNCWPFELQHPSVDVNMPYVPEPGVDGPLDASPLDAPPAVPQGAVNEAPLPADVPKS